MNPDIISLNYDICGFTGELPVNTKEVSLSVKNCISRFLRENDFNFRIDSEEQMNQYFKGKEPSEYDILSKYFIPKLCGDFGQELYAIQEGFHFFANDKPSSARFILLSLYSN